MRGENVPLAEQHQDFLRYTPTCVGKTPAVGAAQPADKVHPHMRGENVMALAFPT